MLKPMLEVLNNMKVVLATSAKHRAEILQKTTLRFEIQPSDFQENLNMDQYTFTEYVEATALGKVLNVCEKLKDNSQFPDLIIGLDTMVCFENELFGKPKNESDAVDMLKKLTRSGKPHIVYTGVVLMYKGKITSFTECTKVYMVALSDEEISAYIDTGEPIDKAGAYAIQGLAASFVSRVEGDYNNALGFPLCRITAELKKILQ